MSYYILEDLEVYQLAESFSDEIWAIVSGWEYFAKDTLDKQIVRSADSIGLISLKDMADITLKKIEIFVFLAAVPF